MDKYACKGAMHLKNSALRLYKSIYKSTINIFYSFYNVESYAHSRCCTPSYRIRNYRYGLPLLKMAHSLLYLYHHSTVCYCPMFL
jgi:hypothetical protein